MDAAGTDLHAAELVLEIPDLVAEAGRDLELELGGGGVHLLGQLADQRAGVDDRAASHDGVATDAQAAERYGAP